MKRSIIVVYVSSERREPSSRVTSSRSPILVVGLRQLR
jgi:hypothetical protein